MSEPTKILVGLSWAETVVKLSQTRGWEASNRLQKMLREDRAALVELVAELARNAKFMADTALQLERILKNDCCFGCGNDTGTPHADDCSVTNLSKLLERAKAVTNGG